MAHNGGRDLAPGFVRRVAQGMRYAIRGVTPDGWFGPGQPLQPVAQERARARQFDFPVAVNIQYQPRGYEPIGFHQLRGLADGYDLLRLLIERRKDKLCAQTWGVRPRAKKQVSDRRVLKVEEFLRWPDKENDWATWLRVLIEDTLVIDAATVLPRHTRGGDPYAWEIIDGSTIKPLVDETGRVPLPPSPAYQQVLKGVPAVDYRRDELIYMPRNRRSWKLYGYSPVEQIVLTVNIGLRRQISHMEYFTEGNIPEALVSVPKEWGSDEIARFQRLFDQREAGNTAERRRLKFMPGDMKYVPTRPSEVIDPKFEEWLARVCCYAMGESYLPFVNQANYNQAQTAAQTAVQEGQGPLQKWIKGKIDYLIAHDLGEPDVEFTWDDMDEIDPFAAAQTDQIDINSGVKDAAEVREERGLAPRTNDESGAAPTKSGAKPGETDDGSVSTDQQG